MIYIIFSLFCIIILALGSELLIRGNILIAKKFNLNYFISAIIITGIGTSLPELFVSSFSIFQYPQLAISNLIGSNIFNSMFIFPIGCMLYSISFEDTAIRRETLIMLLIAIVVYFESYTHNFSMLFGLINFLLSIIYFGYLYRIKRDKNNIAKQETHNVKIHSNNLIIIVEILVGIAMLIIGTRLFIYSINNISLRFHIENSALGISLTAIGTSMPEVITTINAAIKKQGQIVLGNLIGSNIINISFILGFITMLEPVTLSPKLTFIYIPFMLFSQLAMFFMIFFYKKSNKILALIFILIYIVFVFKFILFNLLPSFNSIFSI